MLWYTSTSQTVAEPAVIEKPQFIQGTYPKVAVSTATIPLSEDISAYDNPEKVLGYSVALTFNNLIKSLNWLPHLISSPITLSIPSSHLNQLSLLTPCVSEGQIINSVCG